MESEIPSDIILHVTEQITNIHSLYLMRKKIYYFTEPEMF